MFNFAMLQWLIINDNDTESNHTTTNKKNKIHKKRNGSNNYIRKL